ARRVFSSTCTTWTWRATRLPTTSRTGLFGIFRQLPRVFRKAPRRERNYPTEAIRLVPRDRFTAARARPRTVRFTTTSSSLWAGHEAGRETLWRRFRDSGKRPEGDPGSYTSEGGVRGVVSASAVIAA